MDRSTHVTLAGFLAGWVVGMGCGWLWAVMRRAWRDHAGARSATAAVGRAKWLRTWELVALGFLLLAVGAWALGNNAR